MEQAMSKNLALLVILNISDNAKTTHEKAIFLMFQIINP
jgi:hypothetical protein